MLDLPQLHRYLASSVSELMQADLTSLAIPRIGEWEFEPPLAQTAAMTPIMLNAMRSGQIVLREEAEQTEEDPSARRLAIYLGRLGADVAVPLLLGNELVGILLIGPKRSGSTFTSSDLSLLSTVANQAAIAIRNVQLYQKIRASQQYTEAILERLDSAVLTVDANGSPVVANQSAQRMLLGSDGKMVVPPLLRFIARQVFESSREQTDLEFDLRDSAGNPVPVVATVCPFLAESGQVENALIVIRDISVLRRLEDERLRAERLSSVSRVASTLAHEIRNPLASIQTFCQLLPEKYQDREFREGFAQIVFKEVERIDALVGNLLVADRDVRGLWDLVTLAEPLDATLYLVRPMAAQRGLKLEYTAEGVSPLVVGDRAQLQQLFLNLLLNAQDAAEPGSTIQVRLSQSTSGEAVVEISNRGQPIPESDMGCLFEPFFTTKPGGTGLGLLVCKQVTDYHRGRLTVTSSAERGTCFRLSIPTASDSRTPTDAVAPLAIQEPGEESIAIEHSKEAEHSTVNEGFIAMESASLIDDANVTEGPVVTEGHAVTEGPVLTESVTEPVTESVSEPVTESPMVTDNASAPPVSAVGSGPVRSHR
jgi:signal transduction histidine kinase